MIDWAADTFKALIAASALWIAAYLRKRIIPFSLAFQKLIVIVTRVDKLEIKISEIDARALILIETDPDPIFITDTHGNLTKANMSWLVLTGFSDIEHAQGKNYLQAIPDDFLPELEKISNRLEKHQASFEGIIHFKNIKTGELSKRICRSEPMYDLNKVLIGTIGRLTIIK